MSHEIDMSNNKANMAYTNEVPWHGLGAKLEADATLEQWQEAAGLGHSVLAADVNFQGIVDGLSTYPSKKVLFRSDTGAPLSVVSDKYKIVQPGQVMEFYRTLVEQHGGFKMETAGCLDGGRKIWALAQATEDAQFELAGGDIIGRYLLLSTSYDLSLTTTVRQTSVRVVCANTLGAAVQGAPDLSLSHLASFDGEKIKKTLGLDKSWKHFQTQLRKLAKTKVADDKVREYFTQVFFPMPKSGERPSWFSQKGADARVDRLVEITLEAPGQDLKSAKGTAWGLLNAVTYFVDHEARSKGAEARLNKAWFGEGAAIKGRAFELAASFAGADN